MIILLEKKEVVQALAKRVAVRLGVGRTRGVRMDALCRDQPLFPLLKTSESREEP